MHPSAIMNRITLNSESAQRMHTREIVFEPYDAQHLRDTNAEPVLLRAKKELLELDPKWYTTHTLHPTFLPLTPPAGYSTRI